MSRTDAEPTVKGWRPAYDLTTEAADYPEWHGPPERTLLVCTHPRSGSTLLGESIYAAGGLGCPLEYFHRGFRPALAERWRAPDLTSYIRAVHRFRTDRTGVLSAKLFWYDVEETIREQQRDAGEETLDVESAGIAAPDYSRTFAALGQIFPNPTFIHLSRRDRVRSAVSALVAEQTQRWRSLPGAPPPTRTPDVDYDYDRILRLIALGDHCQTQWRAFFAANRIMPLELTYEDLVLKGSVELLTALGRPHSLSAPRLRRQADARSESLVLRFLQEHAKATHPEDLLQIPNCT
jgi:LPS sulfotransferase NodH